MPTMENVTVPIRAEDGVQEFGEWYRSKKGEIWARAYHNFGGFWQEFVNPFRSWTKSHYIAAETDLTDRAMAKLQEVFPAPSKAELERLSVIALTAKNRAETISAKSDFYPIYTTVVAAGVATMSVGLSAPFRTILAIIAFALILVAATIRMKTREQSSYLKELSNMLDHFVKLESPRAP